MNSVLRLPKLASSQKETLSLRGFQAETLESSGQRGQVFPVLLKLYVQQKTQQKTKEGGGGSLKRSEEKEGEKRDKYLLIIK